MDFGAFVSEEGRGAQCKQIPSPQAKFLLLQGS